MQQLAPSPSQQDWPRYGLVSLWDMLEIKAAPFYNAMIAFGRTRALLKETGDLYPAEEKLRTLTPGVQASALEHVDSLGEACAGAGARNTLRSVERLKRSIASAKCTYAQLGEGIDEIDRRFRDELEDAKLFAMNPDEQSSTMAL